MRGKLALVNRTCERGREKGLPLMYSRFGNSSRAYSLHCPMCAPCVITVAPNPFDRLIFVSGAFTGITTVTGIPKAFPWYANAWYIYMGKGEHNNINQEKGAE